MTDNVVIYLLKRHCFKINLVTILYQSSYKLKYIEISTALKCNNDLDTLKNILIFFCPTCYYDEIIVARKTLLFI